MATKKTKKTKRRRQDAPLTGYQPRGRKPKDTPAARARREHIRKILERTAASRSELDARSRGAELGELAKLPVMVEVGPRRTLGTWRDVSADDGYRSKKQAAASPKNQDIYLSPPKRICKTCEKPDHPGMTCKELKEWLDLSERVLRGETTETDELARELAQKRALIPRPRRGRRPKLDSEPTPRDLAEADGRDIDLEAARARLLAMKANDAAPPHHAHLDAAEVVLDQAKDSRPSPHLKTDSAVATSPEPSPSP